MHLMQKGRRRERKREREGDIERRVKKKLVIKINRRWTCK